MIEIHNDDDEILIELWKRIYNYENNFIYKTIYGPVTFFKSFTSNHFSRI